MIVTESYSVDTSEHDFVRLAYVAVMNTAAGHVNEEKSLWLERTSVPKLVEAMRSFFATFQSPPISVVNGQDHLEIYERGADHAPYVHLDNERPSDAPHGGYRWCAMSKSLALKLLSELAVL